MSLTLAENCSEVIEEANDTHVTRQSERQNSLLQTYTRPVCIITTVHRLVLELPRPIRVKLSSLKIKAKMENCEHAFTADGEKISISKYLHCTVRIDNLQSC